MTDLIRRADAIEAVAKAKATDPFGRYDKQNIGIDWALDALKALPSAEAVSREGYHNLLTASNDIDRALREYQAKEEAEAKPTMTEEVREALMRLTMCAREECGMCKYKDECGFDFKYKISTKNMNTILEALSAEAVQGEWVEEDEYGDLWVCDQCGFADEYKYNFCPICGARMHKGGDSE